MRSSYCRKLRSTSSSRLVWGREALARYAARCAAQRRGLRIFFIHHTTPALPNHSPRPPCRVLPRPSPPLRLPSALPPQVSKLEEKITAGLSNVQLSDAASKVVRLFGIIQQRHSEAGVARLLTGFQERIVERVKDDPARFAAARAGLTKSQLVLEVEVLRDHRKQLQVGEGRKGGGLMWGRCGGRDACKRACTTQVGAPTTTRSTHQPRHP